MQTQICWASATGCVTLLTVSEACDPSESGDRNMRHIPIHAEEGQGARVDAQVAAHLSTFTSFAAQTREQDDIIRVRHY